MQSQTFAARAGRWSAQHRKKAILGWFAFVILATVLGGMVGQKTLADEDMGNGESKRGDQIVEAAGFPDQTGEIRARPGQGRLEGRRPQFTAAVNDVVARLEQTEGRRRGREPARRREYAGNVSKDGRSVLVNFELPGDEDAAEELVDAPLAAVAALQQRASARCTLGAVRRRVGRQGDRRGVRRGLPEGRGPLAPDHAGDPARRVRRARRRRPAAAARRHRRAGHDRAARPDQPDPRARRERRRASCCSSASPSASTTRCSTCGARWRSATPAAAPEAALEAAAATSGRAVLDLRLHGDGRDGRHVPRRQRRLRLVRHRHDHRRRRRRCSARSPCCPRCSSFLSRKGWTEKGRVPWVAKRRHKTRRRVARLGRDPRPRAQAPAASSVVAGRRPARRARHPGVLDAHRQPGRRGPAARPRGHADLRPDPGGVPRRQRAGRDRRQGGRRHGAARSRRRSPTCSSEAHRHRRADRADRRRDQPGQDGRDRLDRRCTGDGTDDASERSLAVLRDDVVPATVGRLPRRRGRRDRLHGRVEGLQRRDEARTCRSCSRFVLTLAFLLLLVTFRSIVIPIKAIVLNLLSVGAAYGVLKLVFQDGRLEGAARLPVDRRHHVLAAAVPVRDPLRPVDGLPRVHPQPDPRGGRPRHDAPTRRSRTGSSRRPAS